VGELPFALWLPRKHWGDFATFGGAIQNPGAAEVRAVHFTVDTRQRKLSTKSFSQLSNNRCSKLNSA
jgi:hypothetical protein